MLLALACFSYEECDTEDMGGSRVKCEDRQAHEDIYEHT